MRKDIKKINKKTIISLATIISILLLAGFTTSEILGKNIKVEAGTSEQLESDNDSKDKEEILQEITLDNSGYIPLEKDPNADDVKMVSEKLQSLVKNEKQFPVRDDGKKVVYLTFDDGPSTVVTPKILDILDKNNIKGTFFVLGTSLKDNKKAQEVLKRISLTGHAIANHSYSHKYEYLYPNKKIDVDNFMEDMELYEKEMKSILGKDFATRTIRFPGGYWTWEGRSNIKPILDEKEYSVIEWNVLTKDAEGPPKNAQQMLDIVKARMNELGANADHIVLLMHDINSKEETVKALPLIIEYYRSLGFEFRTMK